MSSQANASSAMHCASRENLAIMELCAQAQVLHRQGRLAEARTAYNTIVRESPNHFEALYMAGVCERQSGDYESAMRLFRRAHRIDPRSAEVQAELASALTDANRHDEALACFDKVIELNPVFPEVHYKRGNALLASRRYNEAILSFEAMTSIDPNHVSAWNNRGIALQRLGRVDEAMVSYDKALSLKPTHVSTLVNRGNALMQLGQQAAIACLDQALAIDPCHAVALSSRIFALDFLADGDFAAHQAARSLWWNRVGAKLAEQRPQHDNAFDPDKRIILGYVSADFRRHSAAFTYRPVMQGHDRSRFEVICYSGSQVDDEVTASFRELADRWRDVRLWSDDQLAQHIRNDRVDILIDLSGHTEGNRLGVFARKPAPIQVTAWGHATGTGLPTMDYLFSDPVMVPQEVRHLFAEQIYDLPCAITIETPQAKRQSEPPVTSNGYLTYGVFNRVSKMSDAAIALWARILQLNPTARLTIKDVGIDIDSVRETLLTKFSAHGITPSRLQLVGTTSREQHLAAYGAIDICLDPFPHGGGVSSWEALHMGVPIVSKIGNALPKRISGAIMSALGLPDWVAGDEDQYVEIALRSTPDRLRAIRRELPDLIAARCGQIAYTKAVEQGYRAMWQKRCAHHGDVS